MRTWSRIPLLAAASAALLVPSLAVSVPLAQASVSGGAAAAGHKSAPAAHRAPAPAPRPGTGKQAAKVAAALKLARASGRAVPVGSSSAVNPDGTLTVTAAAAPGNGVYEVKLPSQLSGATVKSASVTAPVTCSGSASGSPRLSLAVTRPGGGSLGSGGSAWNAARAVSCGSPGAGSASSSLPVTSAVKQAAAGDWRAFTFRLSGAKVAAPKLDVTYTELPETPSGLAVTSGTLKNAGCASSAASPSSSSSKSAAAEAGPAASSPVIAPGSAATLEAGVVNAAGLPSAARFTYWVKGTSKKATVTSGVAGSGTEAKATVPAGFTKGLGKKAVIDWTASAVSPAASASASSSPSSSSASAASAVCALTVDAAAEQGSPAISGGPSGDPVPGTQETWTVSAADASQSGVTPTSVVWGLDAPPPVSDPPSDQVTSIASGDTSAQVQAVVPSPGPHAFYAYVTYSDGSVSSTATSTFTADSDPAISCPSFSGALANTGCTNSDGSAASSSDANQMISNGASDASGTANANGADEAFTASELETAGWNPGGTVTVDGAAFTLPQFGSSSDGNDNVLAAGQTIGMPAATQGTSMVFLVAGTTTDTQSPAPSQVGEPVSPALPGGVDTVGQDCDVYQANFATGVNCDPAPSGTITYADSSTQDYDLEAPGWEHTTPSITPVTLPDRSTTSGLSSQYQTGLYAVTIPVESQKAVQSVTLPDVGAVVGAAPGFDWPAIHVVGMQVVDTTSVTGSLASAVTQPVAAWTGTWASPPEAPRTPSSGSSYANQTLREVTQVSTGGTQVTTTGSGAQTGIAVRLRLSDALADTGTGPLKIGAVTVAPQSSGAAVSGTPVPVLFGGGKTVTIPEGADAYSDPVLLPALTAGEHLSVSIDLTGTYPSLPTSTLCNACSEYESASGTGDQTANTNGSGFTDGSTHSQVLTGLDVLTAGTSAKPTVAVLGSGVIDGLGSGNTAVHGGDRVADDLASSLQNQPGGPAFGVVSAGVDANQVLGDADTGVNTSGGPAALTRLARDVLAEPGVGTVIIDEGEEDLLQGTSEQDLYANGLTELSRELSAWGITTIWATQHACAGYATCTPAADNGRTTLDTDLLAQGLSPGTSCSSVGIPPCQYTADFAAQVDQGDGSAGQDQLTQSADSGDGVNLTPAGYAAETRTIPVITGQTPLAADVPPGS